MRTVEERLGDLAWVLEVDRPLAPKATHEALTRVAERLELTRGLARPEPGPPCTRSLASPAWSAPELIQREQPADARADVWAVGLIGLRLITGRSFWNADATELHALAVEVSTAAIGPAAERFPELRDAPWSGALDAWFARCVCRDRFARFPSTAMAAAQLARILDVQTPCPGFRPRRHLSGWSLFGLGLALSVPVACPLFMLGVAVGAGTGGPNAPAASTPVDPVRTDEVPRMPLARPAVSDGVVSVEPAGAGPEAPGARHRSLHPRGEVLDPWAEQ